MCSDRLSLIQAVNLNPHEDTPRLIYADYLDENATSDRDRIQAELIRVQCRMAGFNSLTPLMKCHRPDPNKPTRKASFVDGHLSCECRSDCALCQHVLDQDREQILIVQMQYALRSHKEAIRFSRGFPVVVTSFERIGKLVQDGDKAVWMFTNGWLEEAGELVRTEGASFHITGRKPFHLAKDPNIRMGYCWHYQDDEAVGRGSHTLPRRIRPSAEQIIDRDMWCYRTEEEAYAAFNEEVTRIVVNAAYSLQEIRT